MKAFLKLGVPAAAFVVAASFGALTSTSASAGDYCRQDVSGHMTGCGFSSMEQCQSASAGIGGDCFRDPNLPAATANATSNINRNAYAYQPNGRVTKRSRAHGGDANTNQ